MSKSKRQIYKESLASHKMENTARALTEALQLVSERETMFVVSHEKCPKCKEDLKDIRVEPGFKRLITFCVHCHYFSFFNIDGTRKPIPRERVSSRPIHLIPVKNPKRPLERMIHKHMRHIRKEHT